MEVFTVSLQMYTCVSRTATQSDVVSAIQGLNDDCSVHAILLQLPLDSDELIDAEMCTNAIAVEKVCVVNSSCLISTTS